MHISALHVSYCRSELKFWLAKIREFNGQNLWPKPSAVRVVFSDASDTGFGGYTVEHGGLIANGRGKRPSKALHGDNLEQSD